MKFLTAFLFSLLLISCALMQPKSVRNSNLLSEKEITAITQLIGKEKIAKEVYENFYQQYQNNLFGNIAKRKQKHIDIWKNILAKQNISVEENEALVAEYKIKNLPTCIHLDIDGKEVSRFVGFDKNKIDEMLEKV